KDLLGGGGELGHQRHVRQYRDVDVLHRERASVLRPLRRERRDVHRHGNDPPYRARPRLLTCRVRRIELDHLAARGNDGALALGEQLIAIVTNDSQRDHQALAAGTPKATPRARVKPAARETSRVAVSYKLRSDERHSTRRWQQL